ncbi:GNAT family N-acetyltransferase [Algoriphagus sp.]|uniref:GNAT family N-acetyltransferase n=1 Tax=Algoriphagus sp. TaxID=1872435 RepID=UPI0026217380|nr:GNAT family N-acetyltransferase [Algoriphagus sp.]
MKLIRYKKGLEKYFSQLNHAWVVKYFDIEPMDEALLQNPEGTILSKGGQILFVEYQGQIIGTVALKPPGQGAIELSKMAVDEAFQGLGAGKFLCHSAIEEAKRMKAEKMVLYTNSNLKPAIGIYEKHGFQKVPLEGQQYKRADIKMELILNSKTGIKWFDRTFDMNLGENDFEGLLMRLESFFSQIETATSELAESVLSIRQNGKWSIKEHTGHLFLLEPLWQKRFFEISEAKSAMSPADLSNSATDKSFFNLQQFGKILSAFREERIKTLKLLKGFSGSDFQARIQHPRLKRPMGVFDLMFFVAEHDAHHLASILKIRNSTHG